MNPRRRRLLIPGLLVALVVVVVVASLAREARAADGADAQVVSRIDDPRVVESSGLAVSDVHADLAYSVDDSGGAAVVDAVRISTGEVVGQTALAGVELVDAEALALHDGTLWVADVGDNQAGRDDAALYALDEPGPGDHVARTTRYPVGYEDGAHDVESFAIDPRDGRMLVVTKELLAGRLLALPDRLDPATVNVARALDASTLLLATDAAFSPDGRHLLVRNYTSVEVLDATTWASLRVVELPEQDQGETLAFEPSGRSYLVGSEGASSQLWRLGFDAPGAAPAPEPATAPPPPERAGAGPWLTPAIAVAGVGLLALVSVWTSRSTRQRRRRRRRLV